jgi:hypothetical protein
VLPHWATICRDLGPVNAYHGRTDAYLVGLQSDAVATHEGSIDELNALLAEAAAADPGSRIEFRDRIAKFGVAAIEGIAPWLTDARLGAFAVRVAERAAGYGARDEALRALSQAIKVGSSTHVVADASAALQRLSPGARPSRSAGPRKPAARREPTMAPEDLVVGKSYKRKDLHAQALGGNPQTGISYPAGGSYALVFSDPTKAREHGYKDHWEGEEYHYYGQWIGEGDMVFELGNRAMIDLRNELYLLIAGPGGHRFEGHFRLDRDYVVTTERDGREARAIVFVLARVAD